MGRALALVVVLTTLAEGTAQPPANPPTIPLKAEIDLGPLDDYFRVLTSEQVIDPARGITVVLKLQAKKDVDTSQFFLKAGFFDKENHLHQASPVRFDAAFPLKKDESMRVEIWAGRTQKPWHRVTLRRIEKEVPKSEYHYQ